MLEDHPSLSEIQQYCSLSCAVFQISSHFGQMMTSSFFTFYAIEQYLISGGYALKIMEILRVTYVVDVMIIMMS